MADPIDNAPPPAEVPAAVMRIEIARLQLAPGDVLVVRARFSEASEPDRLFEELKAILPTGTPFVIFDHDTQLDVVPAEAAMRALAPVTADFPEPDLEYFKKPAEERRQSMTFGETT